MTHACTYVALEFLSYICFRISSSSAVHIIDQKHFVSMFENEPFVCNTLIRDQIV